MYTPFWNIGTFLTLLLCNPISGILLSSLIFFILSKWLLFLFLSSNHFPYFIPSLLSFLPMESLFLWIPEYIKLLSFLFIPHPHSATLTLPWYQGSFSLTYFLQTTSSTTMIFSQRTSFLALLQNFIPCDYNIQCLL